MNSAHGTTTTSGPQVGSTTPEQASATGSSDFRPGTVAAVVSVLRSLLLEDAAITDHARWRTYECGRLAHYRVVPALVVMPETSEQLAAVVRACARERAPFVARGSGTSLSGGALPRADGVLVVTSRMHTIRDVCRHDQRAVVEPGVINLAVTNAAAPHGYYYAPDSSSQQICSIGGNVAENSGGAHCLKYGFTTNHVLGVELATPGGNARDRQPWMPDAACRGTRARRVAHRDGAHRRGARRFDPRAVGKCADRKAGVRRG